ncbi:WD40 repeat-like protein [Whalleya microplaca]|nr:WD40 repeat-like protein [Whalleya microplaca]
MRLRQSNQGKSFRLHDIAPDLELSDGEQKLLAQQQDDSSDEGFVVEAEGPADQDEDVEIQDSPNAEGAAKKPRSRRKKRSRVPDPTRPFGEVQIYPTDPSQKWTRTYTGPVKRWTRFADLKRYWFGDRDNFNVIVDEFLDLWWEHELIPPKLQYSHELARARNGWMPDDFTEDQEAKFCHWYKRYLSMQTKRQMSTVIDKAQELTYRGISPQTDEQLSVSLGYVTNQKEYHVKPGKSISFSGSGMPIESKDDEIQSSGWLFDVGGIVLSMGWAPASGPGDQFLAMAVIPFSDQAFYRDLKEVPKRSDMKEGIVQIWRFQSEKDARGIVQPARRSPRLVHALCFPWSRAIRMQWCPVPLTVDDRQAGLLAVLCGDGKLRVLEVRKVLRGQESTFEEIQEPFTTLDPPGEHTLEITCFTWINMNRIAVGLSDGSVAVWSISPCQQLQRHPVHSSYIMDIVSGYPSHPFIIATIPMGGVMIVTDLNRPNAERTYHPNLVVSLQPNLLTWSDHLRGFAAIWPSSFPGTSTIAFVQARVFPLSRHLCTVESQSTCLAMGSCHPYLLVGTSDGSVWALNLLRKIASHRQKTPKMRLFQHEYCPPLPLNVQNNGKGQEPRRGSCRILHGFKPELNFHPLAARIAMVSRIKKNRAKKETGKKETEKKKKGKGKAAKDQPDKPTQDQGQGNMSDGPPEVDEENPDGTSMVPGPIVVHEAQTRITALAWNPNIEFSWWAAAALGSGLVRVMDLGVETQGEQPRPQDRTKPDEPRSADDTVMNDEYETDGDSDGDIDMM